MNDQSNVSQLVVGRDIPIQMPGWQDIISVVKQKKMSCHFQIEIEREADGRWIAEIPNLPGVMAYGKTRQEAVRSVRTLTLRVLANNPSN